MSPSLDLLRLRLFTSGEVSGEDVLRGRLDAGS
jgi:hypothetical protein